MKISPKLWCFFGVHQWKIIDQGPYSLRDGSVEVQTGTWFNLQCGVCGCVKMRKCL